VNDSDMAKLGMPKHWRIIKARRRIGLPYLAQTGRYTLTSGVYADTKAVFATEYEHEFANRAAAVEWLRTTPETWGSKAYIKELQ
jgi:hypothetical protein